MKVGVEEVRDEPMVDESEEAKQPFYQQEEQKLPENNLKVAI